MLTHQKTDLCLKEILILSRTTTLDLSLLLAFQATTYVCFTPAFLIFNFNYS